MKVLLDHCVPCPFAQLLVGHEVRTSKSMGWSGLSNGDLLSRAAGEFGAFITIDKSLMHQQSRADLPLPVIVMQVLDNRIDSIAILAPKVLRLLGQAPQRRVYVVGRDRA